MKDEFEHNGEEWVVADIGPGSSEWDVNIYSPEKDVDDWVGPEDVAAWMAQEEGEEL